MAATISKRPLSGLSSADRTRRGMLSTAMRSSSDSRSNLSLSSNSGNSSSTTNISNTNQITSSPTVSSLTDHDYIAMESDASVAARMLERFPRMPHHQRCDFLLSILKLCDPNDMHYLSQIVPRLHRDFVSLLPSSVCHRILGYVNPCDLATAAQVSKKWLKVVSDTSLWTFLYTMIGLSTMSTVFYLSDCSVRMNARRLESTRSWVHGKFWYRSFRAHVLGILCMACDGKLVITGSTDKTCRIHSLRTGTLLYTLTGHDEGVFSVQFDTKVVVTGSADTTVRVWSIHDGTGLAVLYGHSDTVSCIKVNGHVVVTGSEDKTIRIWDIHQLATDATQTDTKHGPVNHVAYTDESVDLIESMHKPSQRYRSDSNAPPMTVPGLNDGVETGIGTLKPNLQNMEFTTPGIVVPVSVGYNSRVGNINTKRDQRHLKPGTHHVTLKHTTLDAHEGVTGTGFGAPSMNASDHRIKSLRTLHGHTGAIKCIDFMDQVLVSGDIHGIVRLWHMDSGNCIAILGLNKVVSDVPLVFLDDKMMQSITKPVSRTTNININIMNTTSSIPIRRDPISSVKMTDNRLLITTLAGSLVLVDMVKPKMVPQQLNRAYEALRVWANDPKTYGFTRRFDMKQVDNTRIINTNEYGVTKTMGVLMSGSGVSENTSPSPINRVASLLGKNMDGGTASQRSSVRSRTDGTPLPTPSHQLQPVSIPRSNWTLCSHVDDWRLICGGSDGKCIVWNHRTGHLIYTLKGSVVETGFGLDVGHVSGNVTNSMVDTGRIGSTHGADRVHGSMIDHATTHININPDRPQIRVTMTDVPRTVVQDTDSPITSKLSPSGIKTVSVRDRAITGVSFDDACIVAAGMDGYIKIWSVFADT